MADAGHEATEKLLKKLEKDIGREYKIATDEMQAKLTAYLEKTEAQRQVQESLLNAGKITKKEYSDWCYRHNMMGKRWTEMRDVLASDMHHTNEIAKGMMKERMPDVYALNGNYATYQIEHDGRIDTGFTLYNHDTAEYLLGDQRQLMPKPSPAKARQIAANPDMQWNQQKIQSAVLQGVLQGESPYKVAERLRNVGQMNYNSSIRYARTMTTSAQNAGRYEAYRRARDLGVDLTIEWQATLDHRTRHAHRQMHGQRTEVDKPFHTPDGYTIYYPADCTGESNAPQKEIWNCRCTLLSWVKGFEGSTVRSSPKLGEQTFAEWQNEHSKEKPTLTVKNVTSEYLENAKNGKTVIRDGYIEKNHKEEILVAEWIANKFGGTIELLPEGKQKTPDYLWNKKNWELKTPTTETAVDAAVRKGVKQIEGNVGGVILNFENSINDMTKVETLIEKRMKRASFEQADVIIIEKGNLAEVIRYKK